MRPVCALVVGELWAARPKKNPGDHASNASRFLRRGCNDTFFREKEDSSVKGGKHSVNEGIGKDFYRNANSVKS